MNKTLAHDLANVRHGDHICLPYDSDDDRREAVVPFIAEGLTRGERCLYVLEPGLHEALLGDLSAAGVNASRAVDRGALWLRAPRETYLRSGGFDPDDVLAFIEEMVTAAQTDGFTGLRGSGEMTGGHEAEVPWHTVLSYEARINEWFAQRPFVALCRYHRPSFAPAIIHDVLRTHPVAIVGDRVCRNPYYEKPDLALAQGGEAARVDWMLSRLRWSHRTELRLREMTHSLAGQTARLAADNQSRLDRHQELERALRMRDRFLATMATELALPLATLTEQLHALLPEPAGDGAKTRAQEPHPYHPVDGREATIRRHLKRLGALVEELGGFSRLTNRQAPLELEETDLVDIVRQVLLRHRALLDAAGCTLSFQAEARILGSWDRRRIERLVTNLVTGAAERGPRQPVEIALDADADSAIVCVRHGGAPPASEEEDRVLERIERPAGVPAPRGALGLWSTRELAGALGGAVRVSEAPPGATTLTVELPRCPPRPARQR